MALESLTFWFLDVDYCAGVVNLVKRDFFLVRFFGWSLGVVCFNWLRLMSYLRKKMRYGEYVKTQNVAFGCIRSDFGIHDSLNYTVFQRLMESLNASL